MDQITTALSEASSRKGETERLKEDLAINEKATQGRKGDIEQVTRVTLQEDVDRCGASYSVSAGGRLIQLHLNIAATSGMTTYNCRVQKYRILCMLWYLAFAVNHCVLWGVGGGYAS